VEEVEEETLDFRALVAALVVVEVEAAAADRPAASKADGSELEPNPRVGPGARVKEETRVKTDARVGAASLEERDSKTEVLPFVREEHSFAGEGSFAVLLLKLMVEKSSSVVRTISSRLLEVR